MNESSIIDNFSFGRNETDRLTQWFFDRIRPALNARIIDVCAGTGELAEIVAHEDFQIHLNASDEEQRTTLQQKFRGIERVRQVHRIDFTLPELEEEYKHFQARFRTVIALSFTNPVFYKKSTLKKMGALLKEEGLLVILLPSQTAAFPGIPYDLDEVRRIDFRPLKRLFDGFELLTVDYFELLNDSEIRPAPAPGLYLIAIARKPKSLPGSEPTTQPQ